MRFEDDNGVILSISPAARVLYVEFKRSTSSGRWYELEVYLTRPTGDWRSWKLYYDDRTRALHALERLEALFAGEDKKEALAPKAGKTGLDLNEVEPLREGDEASEAEPKELVYAPLDEMAEAQIEQQPKKRRGRPPGSKNKAKAVANGGDEAQQTA